MLYSGATRTTSSTFPRKTSGIAKPFRLFSLLQSHSPVEGPRFSIGLHAWLRIDGGVNAAATYARFGHDGLVSLLPQSVHFQLHRLQGWIPLPVFPFET